MKQTNKPTLYVTVGLPGSSKSTWAETHKDELNMVIHSSDEIRTELGDVTDQSQNSKVCEILHKRIKEDLLAGKNVCMDATSLSRKRRISFLQQLEKIDCEKICVLFATPIEICKANNLARDRKVPEEVIDRMIRQFEIPCLQEGFTDIQIVWWDYKKDGLGFNHYNDMKEWCNINHNNPNHSLTIGYHMLMAYSLMLDDMIANNTPNIRLLASAILHDCGKPAVKAFKDSKGNSSDIAHYYNHESVSSYLSMFYLHELGWDDTSILYTSLFIGLHMRPFVWDKSDKAKEKDRKLYGNEIISAIQTLNKYDRLAH